MPDLELKWECPRPFDMDRMVVAVCGDGQERVVCVGYEFECCSLDGATGASSPQTVAWPPPESLRAAAGLRASDCRAAALSSSVLACHMQAQ